MSKNPDERPDCESLLHDPYIFEENAGSCKMDENDLGDDNEKLMKKKKP